MVSRFNTEVEVLRAHRRGRSITLVGTGSRCRTCHFLQLHPGARPTFLGCCNKATKRFS